MDKQLTLTHLIDINDGFDRFLLEDILLIVQNSDISSVVSFWGHKKLNIDKADEKYLKKIMLSINALVKANALRRNYYKIKDVLIEDIKKESSTGNTNIDILFNKVDAMVLIEAFFVQIKSALDLLAQSLKPLFGQEFHTWEKKNGKSGLEIANVFENNLSDELETHAAPLVKLIKTHADSITAIVNHRDDTVHYGKLNKVQGFRYSIEKKDVIPPLILINRDESAYVHEYLDEVLKYISEFIQEFIIIALSNLMNDMVSAQKKDGSWGWVTNNSM